MDRSDIAFLSAAELASAIESKDVSPVDAVEAYLDRIERIDPKLNSYITVCPDDARRDAKQAEAEIQRGGYRGPLHGIPIAVKDQIHTKGIRTHRRFNNSSRLCAGRRRHGGGQPETGRSGFIRQAEHERVCSGRPSKLRLRSGPQSLGFGAESGNFQHRLGRCHRRPALRHFTGRRHRRLNPGPGGPLRSGGIEAYMGLGQPLWRGWGRLVSGHYRPHLPHNPKTAQSPWAALLATTPKTHTAARFRCPIIEKLSPATSADSKWVLCVSFWTPKDWV